MYEDIKEQFSSIIKDSQRIPDPKLDSLFIKWEKSKAKFIERFGGLIYEWPEEVEFVLDEKEKKSRVMEFACVVHDNFNNPDLANFIDANVDGFFDNKITSGDKYSVPKEMKLIRAFKFFEKDPARLRAIQDKASNYIQENKIKGTLCFSVHPLDFLTSSENSYNWRSCHSLDGEYRAGNLSYMVDETTFMVYLKGNSGKYYTYGGVEWNSKKWRMLVHVSENDNLMFAGRQYPFSSKNGIDVVLNIYNNLLAEESNNKHLHWINKYSTWKSTYIDSITSTENGLEDISLEERYFLYGHELIGMNQAIKEGRNSLNYNDLLRSSCYKYPYYAILNERFYHRASEIIDKPLQIGGEVRCLHCGDYVIYNPETMRCDDCEMKYGFEENDMYGTCDCCGARIYLDESVSVGDDNLCYNCYDTECFICDCCGEVYYNEDKNYVGEDTWYCSYCYKDYCEDK